MFWRVLCRSSPISGQSCIVGRIVGKNGKRSLGMYTYYDGQHPVWQSNSKTITCDSKDCWCLVEDIIDNVMDRVLEEIDPLYVSA